MQIRHARASDAHSIARVHVNSWQSAYKGLLPADYLENLSVVQRARMWKNALTASQTELNVCEDENRVVGFVAYGAGRDDDAKSRQSGEIYAIYLESASWGKGYGKKLLDVALYSLQNGGFVEVVLWVLSSNERAIHFYKRNGFSHDGIKKTEALAEGIVVTESRYTRPFGANM